MPAAPPPGRLSRLAGPIPPIEIAVFLPSLLVPPRAGGAQPEPVSEWQRLRTAELIREGPQVYIRLIASRSWKSRPKDTS